MLTVTDCPKEYCFLQRKMFQWIFGKSDGPPEKENLGESHSEDTGERSKSKERERSSSRDTTSGERDRSRRIKNRRRSSSVG